MKTDPGWDYLLRGLPARAAGNLVRQLFMTDERNDCLVLRSQFVDDDGRPMRISQGAMRSMIDRAIEG